jgi:hypothetical protein
MRRPAVPAQEAAIGGAGRAALSFSWHNLDPDIYHGQLQRPDIKAADARLKKLQDTLLKLTGGPNREADAPTMPRLRHNANGTESSPGPESAEDFLARLMSDSKEKLEQIMNELKKQENSEVVAAVGIKLVEQEEKMFLQYAGKVEKELADMKTNEAVAKLIPYVYKHNKYGTPQLMKLLRCDIKQEHNGLTPGEIEQKRCVRASAVEKIRKIMVENSLATHVLIKYMMCVQNKLSQLTAADGAVRQILAAKECISKKIIHYTQQDRRISSPVQTILDTERQYEIIEREIFPLLPTQEIMGRITHLLPTAQTDTLLKEQEERKTAISETAARVEATMEKAIVEVVAANSNSTKLARAALPAHL